MAPELAPSASAQARFLKAGATRCRKPLLLFFLFLIITPWCKALVKVIDETHPDVMRGQPLSTLSLSLSSSSTTVSDAPRTAKKKHEKQTPKNTYNQVQGNRILNCCVQYPSEKHAQDNQVLKIFRVHLESLRGASPPGRKARGLRERSPPQHCRAVLLLAQRRQRNCKPFGC